MGGGGQNVGKANIEVGADVAKAQKQLDDFFKKQQAALAKLTSSWQNAANKQAAAAEKAAQRQAQAIQRAAEKQAQAAQRAAERAAAAKEKEIQAAIRAEQKKADAAVKAREREAAAAQKAAAAQQSKLNRIHADAIAADRARTAKIIADREKEVAAAQRAAEREVAVNQRKNERIIAQEQRRAAATQKAQINLAHAAAIKDNKIFDEQVANSQLNIFGRFAKGVDGLDGKLKRFGITSRDLSVILGAGLAGGVAFAIRSLLQFAAAAVQAASALQQMRNQSDVIFGSASESVRKFAANAADALGVSERAALSYINVLGGIAKGVGFSETASAEFGKELTKLATDLASFKDIPVEQALTAIRGGLTGENEALKTLGIVLDETQLKQRAVTLGIARYGEVLNGTQKFIAARSLLLEKMSDAQGDLARTDGEFATSQKQIGAAFEELTASLGEFFLPAVAAIAKAVNDTLGPVLKALKSANDALDKIPGVGGDDVSVNEQAAADRKAIQLTDAEIERQLRRNKVLQDAGLSVRSTRIENQAMYNALEQRGKSWDKETQQIVDNSAAKAANAAQTKINAAAEQEMALAQGKVDDLTRRVTEHAEELIEREKTLKQVREDSAREIFRAERDLTKAREDGVRNVFRAERDLFRARRDAARSIADAEEKLADARKAAFRSIRDAREKLEDFERESTARTKEAERSLRDAILARLRAILDAQISLQRALIQGDAFAENEARLNLARAQQDKGVQEAKRKLDDEQADRLRELARLHRDLAEAREDAADQIADAARDLERTIVDANEKIADAQEKVADAVRESQEAILSAQERVNDAIREGNEAIAEAEKAYRELADEVRELAEAQRKLNEYTEHFINDILGSSAGAGDGSDIVGVGNPEGLAAGGPVIAGKTYWVGEDGPELFRSDIPGTIIPNRGTVPTFTSLAGANQRLLEWLLHIMKGGPILRDSFASPDRGISAQHPIIVYEAADPEATAFAVWSRIMAGVVR